METNKQNHPLYNEARRLSKLKLTRDNWDIEGDRDFPPRDPTPDPMRKSSGNDDETEAPKSDVLHSAMNPMPRQPRSPEQKTEKYFKKRVHKDRKRQIPHEKAIMRRLYEVYKEKKPFSTIYTTNMKNKSVQFRLTREECGRYPRQLKRNKPNMDLMVATVVTTIMEGQDYLFCSDMVSQEEEVKPEKAELGKRIRIHILDQQQAEKVVGEDFKNFTQIGIAPHLLNPTNDPEFRYAMADLEFHGTIQYPPEKKGKETVRRVRVRLTPSAELKHLWRELCVESKQKEKSAKAEEKENETDGQSEEYGSYSSANDDILYDYQDRHRRPPPKAYDTSKNDRQPLPKTYDKSNNDQQGWLHPAQAKGRNDTQRALMASYETTKPQRSETEEAIWRMTEELSKLKAKFEEEQKQKTSYDQYASPIRQHGQQENEQKYDTPRTYKRPSDAIFSKRTNYAAQWNDWFENDPYRQSIKLQRENDAAAHVVEISRYRVQELIEYREKKRKEANDQMTEAEEYIDRARHRISDQLTKIPEKAIGNGETRAPQNVVEDYLAAAMGWIPAASIDDEEYAKWLEEPDTTSNQNGTNEQNLFHLRNCTSKIIDKRGQSLGREANMRSFRGLRLYQHRMKYYDKRGERRSVVGRVYLWQFPLEWDQMRHAMEGLLPPTWRRENYWRETRRQIREMDEQNRHQKRR